MSAQIIRRPISQNISTLSDELPPLLARIYAARGVNSPAEVSRQLKGLHNYQSLKDIDRAAHILPTPFADRNTY